MQGICTFRLYDNFKGELIKTTVLQHSCLWSLQTVGNPLKKWGWFFVCFSLFFKIMYPGPWILLCSRGLLEFLILLPSQYLGYRCTSPFYTVLGSNPELPEHLKALWQLSYIPSSCSVFYCWSLDLGPSAYILSPTHLPFRHWVTLQQKSEFWQSWMLRQNTSDSPFT